jgi:hypothetical protein
METKNPFGIKGKKDTGGRKKETSELFLARGRG